MKKSLWHPPRPPRFTPCDFTAEARRTRGQAVYLFPILFILCIPSRPFASIYFPSGGPMARSRAASKPKQGGSLPFGGRIASPVGYSAP